MNAGKSKERCFIKFWENPSFSQPSSPTAAPPHPTRRWVNFLEPQSPHTSPCEHLRGHRSSSWLPLGDPLPVPGGSPQSPWAVLFPGPLRRPPGSYCGEARLFFMPGSCWSGRNALPGVAVCHLATDSLPSLNYLTCKTGQFKYPLLQEASPLSGMLLIPAMLGISLTL